MDAVGANIRVDTRGAEVMRMLPRLNEEVNEEWLADKSRFAYDGLKRQRLTTPMVRNAEGMLVESTWEEALARVSKALNKARPQEIAAVAGPFADVETMVVLKDMLTRFGCENFELRDNQPKLPFDLRSQYTLNAKIAGIEEADALLLVGTNPRWEAPLINARIRKAAVNNKLKVASVGPAEDLTYAYQHLGVSTKTLLDIAEARHPFASVLAKAKKPMVVVGAGALAREDGRAVLAAVEAIAKHSAVRQGDWNGLSVLHTEASRVGALDVGFAQQAVDAPKPKFVYLLGAEDVNPEALDSKAFVVYHGHHGDQGALLADVILPGAAYTEKAGTYVNTEGRVQRTKQAVNSPGDSRPDWAIVRALSEVAGKTLPYDDVHAVRRRMAELAPHLLKYDAVEATQFAATATPAETQALSAAPFATTVENYYMTDAISRSSQNMAKCTNQVLPQRQSNFVNSL
eukprot:GILI01001732.1.p1 GENE.GILI01001732.1~~GILI01001732.1.p1  ORF type:complete len:459 (+),score=198.05 GILI01001732.1:502-1878(+)